MCKITAIVLAAGVGSRMKSNVPKQFMELNGQPIMYYSLKAFQESEVSRIVLVTNPEYIEECRNDIVEKNHFDKVTAIIAGGSERYWSVWNGLSEAMDSDYVLIHDAARPCLTQKMIKDSIEAVKKWGACTVGVPVKDTIKVVDENNWSIDTPERKLLWQIQTPQSFCLKDLVLAYEKMRESGDADITDDTMIIERYLNKKTKIIMGDYCNIKVTTPEDMGVAELFKKN